VTRVEYSDFYKFVVSVGVALLAIAFALPWAFLREPFDLYFETSKLGSLSAAQRAILAHRLGLLSWVFRYLPWISSACAVAGLVAIFVGLYLWWDRQVVRDRVEDVAAAKAEKELQGMSAEQQSARVQAEVELSEPETMLSNQQSSSVSKYFEIERRFFDCLEKCLRRSYELLRNQRMGATEFDLILQSLNGSSPDIIVELKVIRQGFKSGWLRESALRLATATQLYKRNMDRTALSVLVIVFLGEMPSRLELDQYDQRVQQALLQLGTTVKIEYMSEASITRTSCQELKKMITP
jgi:hypothetical protein